MYFDDFISKYIIHHDLFIKDINTALIKLNSGVYDIVSFSESIELKSGKKYQLLKTDFITDFTNVTNVYYIIDNKEYLLEKDTILFLSLTPLKPVELLYKNNEDDTKILSYRRYCVKQDVLDTIVYKNMLCKNIRYYYGEASVIPTESCKLIK